MGREIQNLFFLMSSNRLQGVKKVTQKSSELIFFFPYLVILVSDSKRLSTTFLLYSQIPITVYRTPKHNFLAFNLFKIQPEVHKICLSFMTRLFIKYLAYTVYSIYDLLADNRPNPNHQTVQCCTMTGL